jgi:acyl-CoA thioesterase-1
MGLVYRTLRAAATAAWAVGLVACAAAPEPKPTAASASPAAPTEGPLVVFLGDSLTAGYGLDVEQAFPALVGAALVAEGRPVRVVNAGVSGDTSAGGLARLDWLLRQRPDVLVVGLGANDGLRGQPPETTEANLVEIVRRARKAGAKVLLLGMKIPPSYGPQYARQFERLYERVADATDVPLMPFLLVDVAARPELNLSDGIHPNAEGHRIVAGNLTPYVRELVR